MSLPAELRERIQGLVDSDRVLLFMKGTREAPQCGFSSTVIGILDSLVPEYGTVDVLSDPEIRQGIKAFSDWPTVPQLYVNGEFLGGCDIVQEMHAAGELHAALGVTAPGGSAPTLNVTNEAAEFLRQALKGHEEMALHLSVDARFRNALSLAPGSGEEIEVESNGVRILLDRDSATRANGLTLHVVKTDGGAQLAISNPAVSESGQ